MHVRSLLLVALVAGLALAASGYAYADCHVRVGDHIALYGTTDDPDVFIWDSRFRMRDYEGGSFDQMKALLPHATLAPAGTRAIVQGCVGRFVQSKYLTTPDDAIGIVVVSGSLRGHRGWVLGAAIRMVSDQAGTPR